MYSKKNSSFHGYFVQNVSLVSKKMDKVVILVPKHCMKFHKKLIFAILEENLCFMVKRLRYSQGNVPIKISGLLFCFTQLDFNSD